MEIHTVTAGETLLSIARQYGVSVERLAADNELDIETPLVVGQTIVVLFPARSHTVQAGETLLSIAQAYGVSVNQLLRNNPVLGGEETVYPGQTIIIEYTQPKQGTLTVNGYAYPNIDRTVLRKTLPYLTYLTLFTYGITPEGELVTIDDQEVIDIARSYGVAPLMLLSSLDPSGTFNNALSTLVLTNEEVQTRLIGRILETLRAKNYFGLDIDFEFVLPEEREAYVTFVQRITARLNAEGYPVLVALAPKTSADQPGLLYESHDYAGIGAAANLVLLMTYEWGYTYGPPMAVSPLNKVREVVAFGVSQIPADKILMGGPNYGYDWTLPYVPGEGAARSIGNVMAVDIAREHGADIRFDRVAQAPFFNYYDVQGRQHEVWFEDASSIRAKLALASEFSLHGIAIWNVMRYFPQNWLVLNALYTIRRETL